MALFSQKCDACGSKDEIIAFLKETIERERRDRLDERAEYKRAVDRLLIKENITPIGQCVVTPAAMPAFNPMDMMKIFEEPSPGDS